MSLSSYSKCKRLLKTHNITSRQLHRKKLLDIKKDKGKSFESDTLYKDLTNCLGDDSIYATSISVEEDIWNKFDEIIVKADMIEVSLDTIIKKLKAVIPSKLFFNRTINYIRKKFINKDKTEKLITIVNKN